MTNFNTGLIDVLITCTWQCYVYYWQTTNKKTDCTYTGRQQDKKQQKTDNNVVRTISSHPLDKTEIHIICNGLKAMLTVYKQTVEPAGLKCFFHSRKKKEAELLAVYKQALCLTPTWQKTKLMKSNMTKTMTCYQHATAIKDMTDYLQQNRCTNCLRQTSSQDLTWHEYLNINLTSNYSDILKTDCHSH